MENWVKKITTEAGTVIYHDSKQQPHRIGGPAFEYADGTKAWYVAGVPIPEEEFYRMFQNKTNDACTTSFVPKYRF